MQISCHKHNLKPFLADYIYHKNEKGKPGEMDLPLLKNDITDFLPAPELKIHSRNMKLGFVTDLLEIS